MPMIPFVTRFPELGTRETRCLKVQGLENLPNGKYTFLELYCNEPGCDCRRVIISVLREETGWDKIWATIGYGWESLDFYRKWEGGYSDPMELKGPYLDSLNPQTKYSPVLLDLFRDLIESSDYVERLKRHYRMFRDSIDKEYGPAGDPRKKRNRRLRDPRRRRS